MTFLRGELVIIKEIIRKTDNFQDFWQNNRVELIEYAEQMTGEQIDGLEPLLTMDEVERLARDLWRHNHA